MPTDLELLIRIRAEIADAQAKLSALQQQQNELQASLVGVQAGAEGASTGLREEAAASATAAAAAGEQAASQTRVIAALREARASMTALAAATTTGSAEMAGAIGRAAIAVAGLQTEIHAVRASGGVVTPAQLAGLETYKAQLAGLIGQIGGTGAATAAATGQSRLFTAATAQAGQAIAGKTVSLGALSAGFLRVAGTAGGWLAVLLLIEPAIRKVNDWTERYYTWLLNLAGGHRDSEIATRKHGESIDAYNQRVQRARDEQELLVRTLKAADAGVIENTGNIGTMTAAYLLHQAALHGTLAPTKELAAAAKALGFSLTEAFGAPTRQAVASFFEHLEAHERAGENSTRRFKEENRKTIEEWVKGYEDAKQQIPPKLLEVANSMKILTAAQEKVTAGLEAEIAHLRDYWDWMNKARQATGEFADEHARAAGMLERSAVQIFDFNTGLETTHLNLKNNMTPLENLLDALGGLARELNGVDEASDRAFATGEAQ